MSILQHFRSWRCLGWKSRTFPSQTHSNWPLTSYSVQYLLATANLCTNRPQTGLGMFWIYKCHSRHWTWDWCFCRHSTCASGSDSAPPGWPRTCFCTAVCACRCPTRPLSRTDCRWSLGIRPVSSMLMLLSSSLGCFLRMFLPTHLCSLSIGRGRICWSWGILRCRRKGCTGNLRILWQSCLYFNRFCWSICLACLRM